MPQCDSSETNPHMAGPDHGTQDEEPADDDPPVPFRSEFAQPFQYPVHSSASLPGGHHRAALPPGRRVARWIDTVFLRGRTGMSARHHSPGSSRSPGLAPEYVPDYDEYAPP